MEEKVRETTKQIRLIGNSTYWMRGSTKENFNRVWDYLEEEYKIAQDKHKKLKKSFTDISRELGIDIDSVKLICFILISIHPKPLIRIQARHVSKNKQVSLTNYVIFVKNKWH